MMISWEEILKKKYQQDQLAHFYIIEALQSQIDPNELSLKPVRLLQEILAVNDVRNHEDVLIVCPKANGNYVLEDFAEMFSFLNYKATRAKRKFLIIEQVEKLTHHVSNKLLKTLEEPPVETTIFFINNKKANLLSTIKSRAITLRVQIKNQQNVEAIEPTQLTKYHHLQLADIIDDLKTNMPEHTALLKQLITWCNEQCSDVKLIGQLDQILREYQQDELYHNAPTHRLYALAQFLKNIAPPTQSN
jgi:hypothetical protein